MYGNNKSITQIWAFFFQRKGFENIDKNWGIFSQNHLRPVIKSVKKSVLCKFQT
jgi:hypothetical protein